MADANIEILKRETYLRVIENSIGSKLFNSLIVRFRDSGVTTDILMDGNLSCAFFVSSVLSLLQMIDRSSTTVVSLKEKLKTSKNWNEVDTGSVQPGDVIFYIVVTHKDGSTTAHVAFGLNQDEAVSTSSEQKMIVRHSITNQPIECVYRYAWEGSDLK